LLVYPYGPEGGPSAPKSNSNLKSHIIYSKVGRASNLLDIYEVIEIVTILLKYHTKRSSLGLLL
jgi:hypothetical protein